MTFQRIALFIVLCLPSGTKLIAQTVDLNAHIEQSKQRTPVPARSTLPMSQDNVGMFRRDPYSLSR